MDSLISKMADYLDSEEFYNLAQTYRNMSPYAQFEVVWAFDNLKQGIIKAIARNNSEQHSELGQIKSEVKAKSSRENGKLGGRPRKDETK